MKKKVISLIMVIGVVISISPNMLTMTVSADSIDDAINAKIDSLYDLIGGTYFNVPHAASGCGSKHSGHSCDNCYTPNIVNAQWFIDIFGYCSTSNFANSYGNGTTYSRAGWSCLGFANFAEWYIFKPSDGGQVNTTKIGTYSSNYTNASTYCQVGDELRFGNSHSAIFLWADSYGFYVLDSNWSGTGYNCCVQKHYVSYGYESTFTISRATNREDIEPVGPPTDVGMICNYENMTVNPGTQIRFNFWYTNGDSFDIIIDKNGTEYEHFNNVSSPFYYTPKEGGDYLAKGYAKNGAGTTESNKRAFYVDYTEPPTNVGMICNYENMTVMPGTAIKLSYWCTNATQFDLTIYKDDMVYEQFDDIGNPFYYVPSEKGNYLAVGYAKNKVGKTISNKRVFYVSESTSAVIPDGTYSILSAVDTRYSLNVYARDPTDNNTIIIWQDPTQKFDVEYLGSGLYKITSAVTGKVLDAAYAQMEPGTDLVQYTWNGWIGQKWKIECSDDGYFYIINCLNGLYIDLTNSDANNGTNVQLYSKNNTTAQKWLFSPLQYTITFNPNGGTTPTKNKTVTYQSTYGDLPTPTLKGYRFKGWFTSANGGTQITSETKVTITNNQTLYAQWEKAEYSIKYDTNGGTGNIPESSYPIDKNGKITDIEPTRVGYRFLGWSKSKIAKSPTYKANDIYTEKADITLYAVWKILPAINASINKKATYSLISIALSNADEGTSVIISAYKDGRLTGLQIETYDNDDLSVATFAEYDTIKIMLWDNIGTMQPMCKPAIIK